MIRHFTPQTKVKDVLKNPIGKDLFSTLIRLSGSKLSFLTNPFFKQVTLSGLVKLSKGKIDDAFIEMICYKLNTYSKERLVQSDEINETWWKEEVVYQIYPRSFQDSDGDGIGDINGIISRLDYLKELGITMIWLTPVYDSPNADNGYDVRDYKKILAEFGTMKDFDKLLSEVHKRDMKLMMDMVLNHTSDEHQWFREAIKDPKSTKRDYYFIRSGGEDGTIPNDWSSFFYGPAWEYDEDAEEWYLHLFSKNQPDLNWENPHMRNELYKILNWWMEKGVDGFRLDVINMISKAEGLPNGNDVIAELTHVRGLEHYVYGPKIHKYLREMNLNTFANYPVVTVGETGGIGMQVSKYFSDESRKEVDMIFNFDHFDNPGKDRFNIYEYDLNYLKDYYIDWQTNYGNSCHQTLFFNNHDTPRMISKVSCDHENKDQLAKMLAMMQMTLSGIPFLYQGDEIAMINSEFDSIDEFRDVETLNRYELYHDTKPEDVLMQELRCGSRDNARVPMQWDMSANAGFSSGTPWIAVNPDYINTNVEKNLGNEDSVYHFYRRLIQIRKQDKAFVYGNFKTYRPNVKNQFLYYKTYRGQTYYIELNLTNKTVPKILTRDTNRMLLSNYNYHSVKELQPYEANLFQVVEKRK